jgi:transcriptional regulator with XRE-family HTH domain
VAVYKYCMANKIEPFYEVLGSKIQEAREARKMTQAQLGLRLNPPSTRASIANIENGKQRVLVHTFVQLAKALAVDIQDLMPAVEPSVQTASPKDVERELRRKLNLAAPQLKKLAVAARPSSPSGRNRI